MQQSYEKKGLDELTGLYNRRYFFEKTHRILMQANDTPMAFIRMDINRFKLINSFYGEKGGDELLLFLSELLRKKLSAYECCSYGRIEGDVFGFCIPYEKKDGEALLMSIVRELADYDTDFLVEPNFGIYEVESKWMSTEDMCIRASMAGKKCKNQYMVYFAYYDISIGNLLVKEQEIMKEMQRALDEEEFQVYFQPKYNVQTGKPFGAEALVRWIHPEKGVVSPAEFIPVFEKNGFIGKLDVYVWETVCRFIRDWEERGIHSGPISVNMSRVDVSNPHLVQILYDLTKKYGISPAMLNLEITESAYMDNPDNINEIIKKLHEIDFMVLMDDFGSGYSSLNTLKDFSVDVLKVDMKFLPLEDHDSKSKKILTSVIRMAGWLQLPVIVEGVETLEQKLFLESIGCEYIQGYFYAKPMIAKEYEKLIRNEIPVPAEMNRRYEDGFYSSMLPPDVIEKIYGDDLTSAYNRRYLNEYLFLKMEDDLKASLSLVVAALRIHDFNETEKKGSKKADKVLIEIADYLVSAVRVQDSVIHYGGGEFLIVFVNCDKDGVKEKMTRITDKSREQFGVRLDYGYSYREHFEKKTEELYNMIDEAEQEMELLL